MANLSSVFGDGDAADLEDSTCPIVLETVPVVKKRNSVVAGLEINYMESDQEGSEEETVKATKKKKIGATGKKAGAKAATVKKVKNVDGKIAGKTIDQHRTSLRLKVIE